MTKDELAAIQRGESVITEQEQLAGRAPTEYADLDMADDFDRAIWQIREDYSDAAEIESELRLAKSWAERVEVDYDEGPSAIGFHKDGSTYWYLIGDACWDADDPRSELLAWVCESRAWVTAERDLLAKNIAALTEDVAKQRAVIERLTKERDEARMLHQDVQIQAIDRGASYQEARAEADRLRSCLRNFESVLKGWLDPAHGVPTAPGAMQGALAYWIDKINEQLATPAPARSNDLRSDYLAAHLWCNQHGVKALIDGKPATLADRVKLLGASRDEARNQAEERRMAWPVLARLQPLRHVLRSWDWAMLLEDERIPDEAVLPVLRAFATVEREENEAAKAKEGGRG